MSVSDHGHDIKALAEPIRADRGFAVELYGALCNSDWRHDVGTDWRCTWRYAAEVVPNLRDCGENYLDFYCSGGEGRITERVAEEMAALGWRGVGHGVRLRVVDPVSGKTEVLGDAGKWALERPGAEGIPAAEPELVMGDIADWGPVEDWAGWAGEDDEQ